MDLPVLVCGAGIGGLTAALALARTRCRVVVLERADQLAEVGAGLQLSPNATHVLADLGLLEPVRALACEPEAIRIRSARDGSDLARVPLGATIKARHGAPYLVVHRGDLQRVLADAVHATPAIDLRLGTVLTEVDVGESSVSGRSPAGLRQDSGTGSALIGADGVRSFVRQSVLGGPPARFSGRTAYRATVPADLVPGALLRETGLWLGRNAHLVHYPIRSGKEFNIVALVEEDWNEDDWSAPASRPDLLARFAGWPSEARELLDLPDHWLKWALCAVDAGTPWASGRTALLGDAAHAMLPFAAQGAAMAIEDAAVLANCLAEKGKSVTDALLSYQSRRQARVARVQRTAAENARIYHLGWPVCLARDAVLKRKSPEALLARFDWIYGWRPPRLGNA